MPEEAPKRRLPKRIVEVTLPEPYQQFTATLWVNMPRSLLEGLYSMDEETIAAAFAQLVIGHDLVDFDGAPYPPAGTPEFFRAIPNDLFAVIRLAARQQEGRLSPPSAGR